MEFWLSRSLLTNFSCTPWNSRYQGAFSRITMKFWLSQSLLTNFSFTRWNYGYQGAFSRTTMEFTKCTIWGKTLFIYITKSIYTGSASLKTLPLDLEPPFARKRVWSSLL
jgi:hypothetical protein